MKTKIVVLHLKEVLFTALFAILGIVLIAMIIILFLPNKVSSKSALSKKLDGDACIHYIVGEYTAPVTLGNQTVHIKVTIDEQGITEISFADINSEMKTMYPLLIPTLEDLSKQIITSQSLDELVYPDDRKYTALVLINALKDALSQAVKTD